jgi:predicted transcriptional regulator
LVKKKETKNIPLRCELHRELKVFAVQKDRDLSDVLEEAVRDFLRKNVPQTEDLRQA